MGSHVYTDKNALLENMFVVREVNDGAKVRSGLETM